jgi:putative resolvase
MIIKLLETKWSKKTYSMKSNLFLNNSIDVLRTNGGHRLYNLVKYSRKNNKKQTTKLKICYCRVSLEKQEADLRRQVKWMKKHYPGYEIIKDIGSGINMKRN